MNSQQDISQLYNALFELESKFKTAVSIALFSFFKKKSSFKKLFLGGLLLDQLYLNVQMKYQLVIISKKP